MSSRVLAFFVSLMLLVSGVMASAPSMAAPGQHPLAVLPAAIDQEPGAVPAPDSAAHEAAETLLDVPDQLEGPRVSQDAPPQARRIAPQAAASLAHPDLEGPQRPPRAWA